MKIQRQSSDRLTLRSFPWRKALWGTSCLLGALVAAGFVLGKSTFVCDRAQTKQCTLAHSYPLHHRTERFPVADLQGAELETSTDSENHPIYRVVLLTRNGPTPFTHSYSQDWRNQTAQVYQVMQFAQDPYQEVLQLRNDLSLGNTLVVLGVGGSGLMVLGYCRAVLCEVDKATRTFTLKQWGLSGVHQRSYSFAEILGLRVDQLQGAGWATLDKTTLGSILARGTSSEEGSGPTARLVMVLKSGAIVPLHTISDGDTDSLVTLAQTIGEFSGLPVLPPWNATATIEQHLNATALLLPGSKAQRQAAVQADQQRLQQDPDNVDTYQHMATALCLLGQQDEAKTLLEQAQARWVGCGDMESVARSYYVQELLKLRDASRWWKIPY